MWAPLSCPGDLVAQSSAPHTCTPTLVLTSVSQTICVPWGQDGLLWALEDIAPSGLLWAQDQGGDRRARMAELATRTPLGWRPYRERLF